MTRSSLTRVLVTVAAAKVLLSLAAVADAFAHGAVVQRGAPLSPLWVSALLVLSYATVGVVLPRTVPGDPRAETFGAYLLLVATAFSRTLLVSGTQFGALSTIAERLRLDALLPLYLWLFVRDFPFRIPLGWRYAWPTRLITLSSAFGVAILVTNLFADLDGKYWVVSEALQIPAIPLLLERARHVGPGDRRRVRFFVGAVALGVLPVGFDVVMGVVRPEWVAMEMRAPWSAVPAVVLASLLLAPLTTAYSVVVDRVMDLTLMARAAIQYALARITVLALMTVPILWALWNAFRAQTHTIVDVLTDRPVSLASAVFTLVAILPVRERLLQLLDRRFFREHYDSEVLLTELIEATRSAGSVSGLAALLSTQIGRALHPASIAVLIRRDDTARFESPEGSSRSLPTTSMLASLLSGSDDPLKIEPDRGTSVMRRLDRDAVAWVAEGDFRMLVPLRGATGQLRGFVALGEKRSELPYSKRDRALLMALGATAGLWLDAQGREGTGPDFGAEGAGRADSAARECPACGLVHEAPSNVCACGTSLVEAGIPAVLAGKFRIERRVGAGGMGIVYRGVDVALGRNVAVKALRSSSAGDAWRLRREARAMSLMTHPNLAVVFGLEFWLGKPLLVSEFVAGGTLADRLAERGPLPLEQIANIGLTLANVLTALHSSAMLHRDIKPANVGFTAEGEVKLLDFGLARAFQTSDSTSDVTTGLVVTGREHSSGTEVGRIVGTPAYMSREALAGGQPDATFDLWSLAVTMLEALTGVNPFKGQRLPDLLKSSPAPDPRQLIDDCPVGVVRFFASALAPDRAARPANAESFAALVVSCWVR